MQKMSALLSNLTILQQQNTTNPLSVKEKFNIQATTTAPPVVLPSGTSSITNQTQKSIKELLYNATGYYIEDEAETGLNDLQTLFLACFATLIPLIILLLTAFGIKILWSKYKRRKENTQYDNIQHEGTNESISRPLHSHLLNDKCDGTNLTINGEDVEVCDGSTINSNNQKNSSNNHSNTNGSIITMTLKNNHLIVETEERNDIEEDSRETTMKYSPGARNGVFVVEVQQGVRRSPSGSTGGDKEYTGSAVNSDQCALVHNPPDKYSDDESFEKIDTTLADVSPTLQSPKSTTRTGLTQSNQSLTNIQPSYCYTNQQGYDNGCFGYPIYNGYVNDEPLRRLPQSDRPIIMSAVYKNPQRITTTVPYLQEKSPTNNNGGGVPLIEINSNDNDEIQQEQNRLGNCSNIDNSLIQDDNLQQNDNISSSSSSAVTVTTAETDVRSADYENKGFECNDNIAKS